jgi:5-methylcytosine-specific restriction endonuclease McrA
MPTVRRLKGPVNGRVLKAERTSPRLRGYTSEWDRYSTHYRRRHPFCAECFRVGRLTYEDVLVDHKLPVSNGGPMFPGDDGVATLCRACHAGKTAMEEYARTTGQVDQIVLWCDEPERRPPGFENWNGTYAALMGARTR